jgi:uncharacterized protein
VEDTPVTHNEAASRFEAVVEGQPAVCVYRLQGREALFTHTEVPPAAQGKGVAAALVKAALAWAEAEGLRVRPLCSYVATYMRRHPETQHLLQR